MIIQALGDASVEVFTVRGQSQFARLSVEADGSGVTVSLSSNSLRNLAMLCEAAADELDARSVGR